MHGSRVLDYGIEPPETSTPLWGDNNISEDDIINSMDFQQSLQKLTSNEREIIQLCNQGYLVREIASILGKPTMTVQDIKERAIRKLKEMMCVVNGVFFGRSEEVS